MRLVRNITTNGTCKYALIEMARITALKADDGSLPPEVRAALQALEQRGLITWGRKGERDEFFAIKLKDKHSTRALDAYADSVHASDPEFAADVRELAERSGEAHPDCKEPD